MEIIKGCSFRGKYDFLSNMKILRPPYYIKWKSKEGVEYIYKSVENYYQAMKSDNKKVWWIFQYISPYESKKLARNIKIDKNIWDNKKKYVMWYALNEKFKDPLLLEKLISIKGDIIEYNYWNDTYW